MDTNFKTFVDTVEEDFFPIQIITLSRFVWKYLTAGLRAQAMVYFGMWSDLLLNQLVFYSCTNNSIFNFCTHERKTYSVVFLPTSFISVYQ